jgi:DNA invertase Pin-like site-specific DNA recombinase
MQYASYYRVSSHSQGSNGLGIESQRQTVKNFIKDAALLCEFTEVESGKNNQRTELTKALNFCKQHNAVLIIAKLDRLSRNAAFIFALRDSGVQFICCDIPDATPLTIGIFAVLAQHERELISQRTKDALKIAKQRGVKLGTPANLTQECRLKGAKKLTEKAQKNENNLRAFAFIKSLRDNGESFTKIASILNDNSFKTARGGAFCTKQVQRVANMYM